MAPVNHTPTAWNSVVTHRAVSGDLPLDVTGDAESHVVHVVHPVDLRHALNLAVAGDAGVRSQRLDVPLVGKVGVAREIMHAHPFDRLLLGPGLAHLLDLGLRRAVTATD